MLQLVCTISVDSWLSLLCLVCSLLLASAAAQAKRASTCVRVTRTTQMLYVVLLATAAGGVVLAFRRGIFILYTMTMRQLVVVLLHSVGIVEIVVQ